MPDNTVMPIVRVAVLAAGSDEESGRAAGRLTELALPAELPLREIIPAVQRTVLPADDGADLDGTPARLSLAPIGGAPFSLDATLDTVGVVDGDLLALQEIPAGPAAPRIIEDIADAAAIFSTARERAWGVGQIQRGAVAAVIAFLLLATALAATFRVGTGHAGGLFALAGVAVVAVVASLAARPRSVSLGTALAVTALAPVAAAFALAVPGDFGAAQLLLAAAGVTAWSIIGIVVFERAIATFTTTAVTGLGVLLFAALATVWELTEIRIGCGLIVFALLVTVQAAQLSALCARLPVPVLPAPGDPTPSAQPLRVLEDLPRRVRVTDAHQTGFLAAGVLLSVAGSVILVGGPVVSPWAWVLVVVAAVGTALRARVWDSAACKAWLLSHSFLVTAALLIVLLVTDRYTAAWWALGVLTVLVAGWVLVASNPRIAAPDTYSLPARRLLGFVAAAVDASVIPLAAYLLGLFEWVLNR
ncbi:transmembrane protein [Mycolicibacterium canariasense]|uniref:Transmembrane protein n=1 Tax=Mycolicibacterium canariasense TaxID=228230 RepID=A0A100WE39_MYCCR|nr:type VII secretion integral membrane protein EccD [Mycolicibacterium canariasense]MCV7209975.1 type VII secretion integral membrane protein EccD [Mycolicibacterium canariasense]ORV05240.1 type VII secretion integral membrane protein EccD [Mycolicibacterium canariasense]GAS96343.1 transmembrane protein [Mycolicibacterium canariasense]